MTAKNSDNELQEGGDTLNMSLGPSLTAKQASGPEGYAVEQPTTQEKHLGPRKVNERVAEMFIRSKAEILASGHFVTPDGLAQRLNMDASGLTAWLARAEAQLQIFSIENDGQVLYPGYAFLADGNCKLIPALQEVLRVFHPKKEGWDLAFWFRSPNTFLGGKRPEDLLDRNLPSIVFAAQEEVSRYMPG